MRQLTTEKNNKKVVQERKGKCKQCRQQEVILEKEL
jgi:hypothetical protein